MSCCSWPPQWATAAGTTRAQALLHTLDSCYLADRLCAAAAHFASWMPAPQSTRTMLTSLRPMCAAAGPHSGRLQRALHVPPAEGQAARGGRCHAAGTLRRGRGCQDRFCRGSRQGTAWLPAWMQTFAVPCLICLQLMKSRQVPKLRAKLREVGVATLQTRCDEAVAAKIAAAEAAVKVCAC